MTDSKDGGSQRSNVPIRAWEWRRYEEVQSDIHGTYDEKVYFLAGFPVERCGCGPISRLLLQNPHFNGFGPC